MVSTNKGISIFPMEDIIFLVGLSNIPLFLFKERAFHGGFFLLTKFYPSIESAMS